jgi:hypothetical protein
MVVIAEQIGEHDGATKAADDLARIVIQAILPKCFPNVSQTSALGCIGAYFGVSRVS